MPSRVRTDKHVLQPSAAANNNATTKRTNAMEAPLTAPKSPYAQPTVSRRDELTLFMHPGLTDACSISHVMRNIGLVMYRDWRYDVLWEHQQNLEPVVSCPSYLGRTESFRGTPTTPYARFGWGINADLMPIGDPLERGRMLVVTSDHGWIRTERAHAKLTLPAVTVIFALSPQCKQAMVDAGIPEEKIVLLPLGVDHTLYKPEGPAFEGEANRWLNDVEPEGKPFTFLCAGYAQPRKGIRETVEAYCRAFAGRRDVALLVKNVVQVGKWGHDETDEYLKIMADYDAPPVGYLQETVSEYQMAALLRDVDCLCNAHRREGFGLMGLQAMACGTPVLTTDYHGPQQYANKDNCYLLPITGDGPEPIPSPDPKTGECIEWANYDLDVLASLMQEAQAGKRKKKIVEAALATAAQWTWTRSAEVVRETVETRMGYLRKRPRKWVSANVTTSVAIPIRNGSDKLAVTLKTLYDCAAPDEVLVYDDASNPDEARAINALASAYRGCRVVTGRKQVGCHEARRIIYEECRGAYIASIDGDMDFSITDNDWAERLIALCKERGNGIMHPLLVYPLKPKGIRTVQSAGGIMRPDLDPPATHRLRGEPVTAPGVGRPCRISYGCGAFQFFPATLLDHIEMDGGYFPANFGDVSICFAARAAGFPVWYCPEVKVIHDAYSWTNSAEAKSTCRPDQTGLRFAQRWLDMEHEDARLYDETGALP